MKQSVYVLVNTEVGKVEGICNELSKIKEVKKVNSVTGPFDIIMLMESDNIKESIVNRIQQMDGIIKTITCLCI
jgi:hypothetical protein